MLAYNSFHNKKHTLKGQVGWGVSQAFHLFYPNYIGEDDILAQCVAHYLTRDSLVLDAGCGSGKFFHYSWKDNVRLLVGCDISDAISYNENITYRIRADLAHLPFAKGSFDVIFSRYVLEHLELPCLVFTELARILKPGGKLVVLTPSKYHYVAMLSRITPHWIHEKISAIRGNPAYDTFPTRYRVNSKAELIQYAEEVGLTLRKIITREACPNYLLWSLPSFLIGVVYERLVNRFECLSRFRSSIIAVLEQ